jgi:hypothetical protein
MALEESIDGLEKLESRSVAAYIAPELREYLGHDAQILVEYVTREWGGSGLVIRLANQNGDGGCA